MGVIVAATPLGPGHRRVRARAGPPLALFFLGLAGAADMMSGVFRP
jgi:hypothetical protein